MEKNASFRKGLAVALLCTGLACSARLMAQAGFDTGTVKGTVYDPKNAVVASATVTVTNESTGVSKTQKSGADGTYTFPALPPGSYQIAVESPGFSKTVGRNITLTVGATVDYDVHLAVGEALEIVLVTDRPPLIDTQQTQQANTVDTRQVENLPNISMNFNQAIYTIPGVANSLAPSIQDPNIGTGYLASGFSVGGSNGRNNLFTIDGGENDFGSGALRVNHVPLESVQEYQVNRNSFAPEFGFTVGTAINVVTKSGSNRFHGNVYGYFHDQATDAANFYNGLGPSPNTKPFEQSLIAGASFGGAIKKEKLFFFTSYERQKLDTPVVVNLLGTAEAQGIAAQTNGYSGGVCPGQTNAYQNVSQLCYLTQLANATQISPAFADVAALGQAFLNPLSPASVIFKPLEDPILNAIISPNSGIFDGNAGGVVQSPAAPDGRFNNWVSRLDYVPNVNDALFLRFSLMREITQVIAPGGQPRVYSSDNVVRDYTLTTEWTHILNPGTVNTVRAQVVPHDTSDNATPLPGRAEIGLGSLGPLGTPFPYPYFGHENRFQFDDGISFVRGSHNLKIGASYRPVEYNIFEQLWFGGQYNFTDGTFPIIDIALAIVGSIFPTIQTDLATFNFINGYSPLGPVATNLTAPEAYVAGLPTTLLQADGNGRWQSWAHYFGAYAQDSWKVTPKLTMNYGARFDYDHEASPVPTSFRVSPRFGIAFDPHNDGKTVVRVGGGLFVAPQIFLIPFYLNLLGTNNQHIILALNTAGGTPQPCLIAPGTPDLPPAICATALEQALATLSNPNPELSIAELGAAGITIVPTGPTAINGVFYTIQHNFKPQYSIQASTSVAQQITSTLSFELGYNMYRGVHIEQNAEANYTINPARAADPFIGPFYEPKPGSTAGEPNAVILQNNQFSSIGDSIYHGLTASLTKSYGRGLQFQANYTWSHAIDDTSDYSSLSTPFRPGLEHLDRSTSSFNITHNFVANAVYTTPFRSGSSGVRGKILGDISVSPIVYARTGVPYTLLVPGMPNNGTNLGNHTSEARPFDETRNLGIGPNFYSWDMRISKAFYISRESDVRLNLIAQSTNILNHTNFSAVNNIFPYTEAVDPRTGQLTAVVPTAEGNVDMLNGPYNYRGYKPTSAAQLASPLAFTSANPPRQLSFGLQLAF